MPNRVADCNDMHILYGTFLRYLSCMYFMLAAWTFANAQATVQTCLDVGKTQVSEGVFLKNLYRGNFRYDRFGVEAGVQFDLHSNNPHVLTGFDMIGSAGFLVKGIPFEAKAFFVLNRFSDLAYETDWGIRLETRKLSHFLFGLGSYFRTYTINSFAREDFDISRTDSKLRENFNLLYIFTAYVKPYQNPWNIGFSCTNMDHYVINQSTNPVFNLQSNYKFQSGFTLYLEAWLKQAGIFNIYANHFGYFIRTGLIWEIG